MVCFPKTFLLDLLDRLCSPNPKSITTPSLGSSYFARHYSRNRVFFLFLWVLRCFSSPRSLHIHYFTHVWIISLFLLIEFPHSDIYGSMDICSSPQLFAAYHVLHRLLVPRHSPYALSSLTFDLFLNHCYSFLVQLFSSIFLAFAFLNTLVYLISSIYFSMCLFIVFKIRIESLVGSNGIEPSTSRLSGVRSNHLSYEPIFQSLNSLSSLVCEPSLYKSMYLFKVH